MNTERLSPRYAEIDSWDPADALEAMIDGQFGAVAAVRAARIALETGRERRWKPAQIRGRLIYVGAGTSGRLAVQDGAELMPTFSWPRERLLLLMAGGEPAFTQSIEGAEDQAIKEFTLSASTRVDSKDVMVAVAASGTTPFTLRVPARGKALAR
jgi:N-acetylmuramic acid 6-phosphate etherase